MEIKFAQSSATTKPSSNKLNAAWSAASSVAGPAAQLLAAPYLISSLGREAYGIILLVNSIVSISGMATMGLGDATVKFVAEFAAANQKPAIITLLQTTLFLYLLLGGATVLVVGALAPSLAGLLFNVGPDLKLAAVLAIRVGACSFVVRLVYSVGESLCRGLRRHDVEAVNGIFNSLAIPGLSCLFVHLGLGIVAAVVSSLVVMATSTVVLATRCSVLLGTYNWMIPSLQFGQFKRLISYGVFSWFQMLEGILCSQADRFIVSSRLGAAAVPQYAICIQITQLASGVVGQAFSYIFPVSADLYARQKWRELNALFNSGLQLTTIASFSIAAILFLYGPTILFVWMGNTLGDYDHRLILILASSAALMGTTTTPYYVLNGAGYVKLNSVFTISSMLSILPCSFVFVKYLGLTGMGIAKMMNVFPGLVARAIIGRLILKDSNLFVGCWQLTPTLGGLAVLWGSEMLWNLPIHAVQHVAFTLGITLASISVTVILSVCIFGKASARTPPLQTVN